MDNPQIPTQRELAEKALALRQQAGMLSYSIKGLSAATGWSRSAIYQMIAAGELVALKDGKRTIVTAESARRRIESLPPFKSKSAA